MLDTLHFGPRNPGGFDGVAFLTLHWDRARRHSMAYGVFEGVAVLQVGHALVGVGGNDAAKIGARNERNVGFQLQIDLKHVGFVAVDAGERIAVVDKEDGNGAGAGCNEIEAVVRRDGSDRKNQVQAAGVFEPDRIAGAVLLWDRQSRLRVTGDAPPSDHGLVLHLRLVVAPGDGGFDGLALCRDQGTQPHRGGEGRLP